MKNLKIKLLFSIRRGLENIYVLKQDSGGVSLPVSNKARSKREEEQSDAKLEGEEEKERERLPLVPRTLER